MRVASVGGNNREAMTRGIARTEHAVDPLAKRHR